MPDQHVCPTCGELTERPFIGSHAKQQIFNYIWDNPGCTLKEIEYYLWGNAVHPANVINVHLSKIRAVLVHTNFVLRSTVLHGRRHAYKIIRRPRPAQPESHDNVPA